VGKKFSPTGTTVLTL
jgi:hypothetical protein